MNIRDRRTGSTRQRRKWLRTLHRTRPSRRPTLERLESRMMLTTSPTGGSGFFDDSGHTLGRSVGVSVELADLDGDGDLDTFAVGNGANEVWLNQGNGSFLNTGQSLGNEDSRDVALADLDGDGDQDALVANDGGNRVWYNDGSGHFTASDQILGSAESTGVGLADLDGDGNIDAFVANADDSSVGGADAANRVLLNNGQGRFTATQQLIGDSDSLDVALNDVDGDGDLDAFVANAGFFGSQPDKVWLNNGEAEFSDSGQSLGSWTSFDVELADVDGDTDVDAVVVGIANRVWLNDGDGDFGDSGQTLTTSIASSVDLADLNGDGGLDLYFTLADGPDGASNQVWWNDGLGDFEDSGQRLGSAFSVDVALGDLDGDTDVDAFVGNDRSDIREDGEANQVWNNNGSGTFQPAQEVGFAETKGVEFGDLNGDGRLDVFLGVFGNANQIWFGDARGDFFDSGQSLGNSDTTAVTLGDLDGDGDLDAFVANQSNHPNRVWINEGNASGNFIDSGQELGRNNTLDVALGDVNGDGHLDAIAVNSGQARATNVWLNDGHGNFSVGLEKLASGNAVALGDMNGDDKLDAMITDWGVPNTVWFNSGLGTFTDSGQRLGSSNSSDVVLGDVDGDGDLDAVVANRSDQPNKIWTNVGAGMYADSLQDLGSDDSYAVVLGDLDADGDLDSLFVGQTTMRAWTNRDGVFQEINQSLPTGAGRSVALGDADDDGDLDAWVGIADGADRLWTNFDTPPLEPDVFEPNNNSATAANLDVNPFSFTGQLQQTHEFLTIHESNNEDWYKWTAPENGQLTVELLFSHEAGDLDMRLYELDGQLSSIEFANSQTDNERITEQVTKGLVYYVQVFGHSGATQASYNLVVSGSEFPPDALEGDTGNDTLETAVDLGSTNQIISELNVHNSRNDDWFKITPASAGILEIDILFTHAQGDLDLNLIAPTAVALDSSSTFNDNESISWTVTSPGSSYYIHVGGFEGDTNPEYTLLVRGMQDATAPTVDIVDVSPDPRASAVDEISIAFSEPVTGFDLSDLTLTRANDTQASLLPGSATLTTTDNVNWVLGGLHGLTNDSGVYQLTLGTAGSGIQDLGGNSLGSGATEQWTNGAGDSNGDHSFDQLDLIQVLRGKKYLSGQPATWGQGDWNQDGIFNQLDVLLVHRTSPPHYLQGPFGATAGVANEQAESLAPAATSEPAAVANVGTANLDIPDDSHSATTDALFAQVGASQSAEPEPMGGVAKPSDVEDTELDLTLL